ncbi:MAG TPA: hypothetical protein VE524_02965 [Nitrososphaeraceae archaeon]|nr:hypothetical protein [Nitrososphaeraceae archaeon]
MFCKSLDIRLIEYDELIVRVGSSIDAEMMVTLFLDSLNLMF